MSDEPEHEDEDEDEESDFFREVLECEVCRAQFRPEEFGHSSCDDVPADAACPRCGGGFSIAGLWADDEEEDAR